MRRPKIDYSKIKLERHAIDDYPTLKGRPKNVNNDKELIARGIDGLRTGKYRSYYAAAKDLAKDALAYQDGKQIKVGAQQTIIDRLRRALSVVDNGLFYRKRRKK